MTPVLGSMFVVVSLIIAFQYKSEMKLREENTTNLLNFISTRILVAYERETNVRPILNYIRDYYEKSTFEEVRLSVYDANGALIDAVGRAFKVPDEVAKEAAEGETGVVSKNANNEMFYYRIKTSVDGQITVHTAMPWNDAIFSMVHVDNKPFIILLLASLIAVVILTYISTNFIVNNIKVLKDFAHKANNPDFQLNDKKLGHDELGDISREIIQLYRGRVKAQEESEKEHSIAMHAIEEKRRVKHQLTNNINHELKTPVGVIRGYLETVLSSDDMDEKTQRYFLSRALSNVERLCSLLNDVSTMTRLEEGSGKIIISEINFHDLVYAIKNDLQQSGILKEITFESDIPLKCSVYANSNLLTSAITNLARNAAIHSHGTEMGITLIAESDHFYTFAFQDNGHGVPEEHVPHLFERFYRVESGRSRKSGGTGLGLPIVKSTIESLGGTISVANRATGGLEFRFTLKKAL